MFRTHYDAIVVGGRLPGLVGAALLAKRGFRVLALAHEDLAPTYEIVTPERGPLELPRAPFNFLAARSPIARRIFAELAIHQPFRRVAESFDPAFQVALPGHRFEMALDRAALAREIEREFPEVRRPIDDLFARLTREMEAIDLALTNDLVLPPETFFERREVAGASAHLGSLEGADLLAALPEAHPFRLAAHAPLRFADAMDPDLAHGVRLVRAIGSWSTGGAGVAGGLAALRKIVLDSFRAHGGELRERDKIDQVLVDRNVANGVRLAASGEDVGATHVILGGNVSQYVRMLPDRRPFESLFESAGEPVVRYYRYTMNVLVADEGLPMGLARDLFVVRDPDRPLAGANLLHVEVAPRTTAPRRVLTVEALLPRRGVEDTAGYLDTIREDLLATLGEFLPFLGEHAELVDSPHDGRPTQDLANGVELDPPAKWARGPHTMDVVHGFPITTTLGVAALPVRTPVKNLLLLGEQNVPGLGMEGTLAAAWAVARIISRSDPRSGIFRRGLFGGFGSR
jgi:phytoene dehydrogenase-like protein